MTVETSIAALTTQTTALLDACTTLKAGTALQISTAVATSTNEALIPLVSMAANLVSTQAMLIPYISR